MKEKLRKEFDWDFFCDVIFRVAVLFAGVSLIGIIWSLVEKRFIFEIPFYIFFGFLVVGAIHAVVTDNKRFKKFLMARQTKNLKRIQRRKNKEMYKKNFPLLLAYAERSGVLETDLGYPYIPYKELRKITIEEKDKQISELANLAAYYCLKIVHRKNEEDYIGPEEAFQNVPNISELTLWNEIAALNSEVEAIDGVLKDLK